MHFQHQYALPATKFFLYPHFLKHKLLTIVFKFGHFYKDKVKSQSFDLHFSGG